MRQTETRPQFKLRRSAKARRGSALPVDFMARTMDAVLHNTSALLFGEGMARIDGFDIHGREVQEVELHDITAVAGLGVPVGLLIAFSFDEALLTDILEKATAGNPVSDDERDLYMREVAAEVVNTVLGHCTADFDLDESVVSLSPPVVIQGARSITRRGDAVFASMRIHTDRGEVSINLFGPHHLFDDRLNYRH